MIVEICVNSIQSALNAIAGGATRIELCQNLEKGGITPDIAEIHTVCTELPLDVMVLVRPRFGNFHYSSKVWNQLENSALITSHMGAKGIVTGMLDRDGNVEVNLLKKLGYRYRGNLLYMDEASRGHDPARQAYVKIWKVKTNHGFDKT